MRKLIAAFKVSLDMKYQGPGDYADWVPAWSEDYDLGDSIDACLLGGAMYRSYEGYWSAMRANPTGPSPMTGTIPTPGELEWSARIPTLPHYVLSRSVGPALWPNTRFLGSIDQISALKAEAGKDIYLMGGGNMLQTLIAAGMVDELRLIVHPLIAGGPNTLFAEQGPRLLLLRINTHDLPDGLVRVNYALMA